MNAGVKSIYPSLNMRLWTRWWQEKCFIFGMQGGTGESLSLNNYRISDSKKWCPYIMRLSTSCQSVHQTVKDIHDISWCYSINWWLNSLVRIHSMIIMAIAYYSGVNCQFVNTIKFYNKLLLYCLLHIDWSLKQDVSYMKRKGCSNYSNTIFIVF